MMADEHGEVGGMRIGRRNRSTKRNPAPVPSCPITNPAWFDLESKPGRHGGKSTTNRLSYYSPCQKLVPFIVMLGAPEIEQFRETPWILARDGDRLLDLRTWVSAADDAYFWQCEVANPRTLPSQEKIPVTQWNHYWRAAPTGNWTSVIQYVASHFLTVSQKRMLHSFNAFCTSSKPTRQ
jgi:hypothetical protein